MNYLADAVQHSTFDPAELLPRLLTEEIAGFYDPRDKKLFLIVELPPEGQKPKKPSVLGRMFGARPSFDPDEQKMVLVHEMTHALQDQHFDLEALDLQVKHDDDALVAFASLVEGDATVAMMIPMSGQKFLRTSPAVAKRMSTMMLATMPFGGGAAFREAPRALTESLIFPYVRGLVFVLALTHETGDWSKVDEAFRAPPLSTEHILHPEKYLSGDDPPLEADLLHLAPKAGVGWREVYRNVLGEMMVELLLRERGHRPSVRAAAGWGGDAYVVLENEQGDLGFVLRTIWDTEKDAAEFRDAWKEGEKPGSEVKAERCHVETRDREVLIVVGLEPRRELLDAAWRSSWRVKAPRKTARF